MAKGKQTCKILKEIRKQIAAENDIKLVIEECTYQGDCLGTCPKCEAEVRYLERELEKRQRMGKAAVVAGLSVGLLGASQVALAQEPDSLNMNQNNLGTLRGDMTIVEYGAIPLYPPPTFPYCHVLTQEEISNVAISKLPKSGNLIVVVTTGSGNPSQIPCLKRRSVFMLQSLKAVSRCLWSSSPKTWAKMPMVTLTATWKWPSRWNPMANCRTLI